MTIPALDQSSARARAPQPVPDRSDEEMANAPDDEQPAPPVIQAECAFIVYRQMDGRTIVTSDLNAPVTVRRAPTTHDVVGMCANATDDVRAQATIPGIANAVVGEMMKMQEAMNAKAQEMAIRQQMANGRPGA